MLGVAVELDGQAVLRPAAVHVAAAGGAVGRREGQPGLAEQRQEPALELAQRDASLATEDLVQVSGTGRVRPVRQGGVDRPCLDAVADLGPVADLPEVVEVEAADDVDEGPRDGGDRDAPVLGDVPPVERDAVGYDALDAGLSA
jgi:hypothetical protein